MPSVNIDPESPSNRDDAAIAAIQEFWSDTGKEQAAEREVPADAPAPRYNAEAANEAQDQEDAEVQAGTIDPTQPDGIPNSKQNKETISQTRQGITRPAPATEESEAALDPVLRSIAEDSGWTAEEIDELFQQNPDAAVRQFTRLADQYAEMSRQFLGTGPGAGAPALPQNLPAQPTQQTVQSPALITDEQLKKFAEDNGEQAANFLKAIRDHSEARLSALEAQAKKSEEKVQAQEMETIGREATAVLAELQGKFPSLYGNGDNPQTLTLAQYQARNSLGLMADDMRRSAIARGAHLSVKDAMTRAHYVVSRDSVKSEARSEIKALVKKRSERATARPTQRNNPTAPGQGKSDDAAIQAAAEKMAEIGLSDE